MLFIGKKKTIQSNHLAYFLKVLPDSWFTSSNEITPAFIHMNTLQFVFIRSSYNSAAKWHCIM